jgi:hypothetical protein
LHARAQAAVAAVKEEYGDAVLLLTAASEEAATLDVDLKLSGGEAGEKQ